MSYVAIPSSTPNKFDVGFYESNIHGLGHSIFHHVCTVGGRITAHKVVSWFNGGNQVTLGVIDIVWAPGYTEPIQEDDVET